MNKLVIWGATGQAVVLEELLSHYTIRIDAFFENNISVKSPVDGIPIYYKEEGLNKWLFETKNVEEYGFLTAIGGNKGNVRFEVGKMLKRKGLKPYTAIHKTAFIAYNALIGEGGQILANSNVCAKVQIGAYCIINTGASIDHECILGDNVHIGPGANLAGCVNVGESVFIGTNATILPRIRIGKHSIVGAGAVVTKDVPSYSTVVGNPAKIIKINFKQ